MITLFTSSPSMYLLFSPLFSLRWKNCLQYNLSHVANKPSGQCNLDTSGICPRITMPVTPWLNTYTIRAISWYYYYESPGILLCTPGSAWAKWIVLLSPDCHWFSARRTSNRQQLSETRVERDWINLQKLSDDSGTAINKDCQYFNTFSIQLVSYLFNFYIPNRNKTVQQNVHIDKCALLPLTQYF